MSRHMGLVVALILAANYSLAAQEPPPKPAVRVWGLAFSPTGAVLAATTASPSAGRLTLYSTDDWRVRGHLEEPEPITAVAFPPDGRTLAIGLNSGTVRWVDADSLAVRRSFTGHTALVRSLVFTDDGRHLFSGSADTHIRLWSLPSGEVERSFEGHRGPVTAVTLSRDGSRIASTSNDGTARLWDVSSGQQRPLSETNAFGCSHVAFSADGRHLLSCHSDAALRIRDATTLGLVARIVVYSPDRACFSPDGKMVAAATFVRERGDLQLFDLSLDQPAADLRDRIDGLIARWDDDDYAVRESASREIEGIGMVAGPQLRAAAAAQSASAEVRLRARLANDRVWAPSPRKTVAVESRLTSLVFSPDGRLLAGGDLSGRVLLWNPVTGEVEKTIPAP